MVVPGSLFIQPVIQRTAAVSSPSVLVMSQKANYVEINNIFAINLTDFPILVSVYVSTNNFLIIPPTKIEANSKLQLLKESFFGLNTGETLFAKSDSSQNLFNIVVEGRSFTELV